MTSAIVIAFIKVASPLVASGLTKFARVIIPFLCRIGSGWMLLIVALLSYLIAIVQSAMTGQPVDPTSITTASDAIVNFLAASGTYFLAKKLAPQQ